MIDLDLSVSEWVIVALVAVFVALVAAAHVGRHLVQTDPGNPWGPRLVLLGVYLRALRKSPGSAYLPPPVRTILESLPESDPPPASRGPLLALLAVGGLASTGCAGFFDDAQAHMDRAAKGIRAAAIVADRADPLLRAEYAAALARCAALPSLDDATACTATTREAWAATREALETVRAMRCASEPGAC
jgi:hypothetical protein